MVAVRALDCQPLFGDGLCIAVDGRLYDFYTKLEEGVLIVTPHQSAKLYRADKSGNSQAALQAIIRAANLLGIVAVLEFKPGRIG